MPPSVYLTDEKRLFRCVPLQGTDSVLLEDCLTLEYFHCQSEELADLRIVKHGVPAGRQAAGWPESSAAEERGDVGDRVDGRARHYA